MTRAERNKDYEINFNKHVDELMKFPDAKLARRLDLIRAQMLYTIKNKDEETYQTLRWWELHTIEARIRKHDLPEVEYINEMEEAITNMETIIIKSEERIEIAEETFVHQKARHLKIQQGNSNQTSLF